jgi:hypothetical protein
MISSNTLPPHFIPIGDNYWFDSKARVNVSVSNGKVMQVAGPPTPPYTPPSVAPRRIVPHHARRPHAALRAIARAPCKLKKN